MTWVRGKVPVATLKDTKAKIIATGEKFIKEVLAPRVVRTFNPRIKKQQCVGISLRAHKSFFRFSALVKDTRDNVIESEYDMPFARLEYRGENSFLCSYMRHNGEWIDFAFGQSISLPEAFTLIAEEPHFDIALTFGPGTRFSGNTSRFCICLDRKVH